MFGLDFFGYYFISSIIIFKVQFSSGWVFGLDFFGYYFISSIIIFKVQELNHIAPTRLADGNASLDLLFQFTVQFSPVQSSSVELGIILFLRSFKVQLN